MVLDDVGANATDSFSDNSSPSDQDAYATSSVRFDPSSLPQPLFGPTILLGFSANTLRFKAESTIQFAERKVGRKLNPEESQALAYHLYQLEQSKSYFAAFAAGVGVYRWWSTWDKMRYPFYQPKLENINPNKFAFIRGPSAQLARQTWRFSLYFLAAGHIGSFIGQIIAQPLAAQNTARDPKLEQFAEELRAAAQAQRQEHPQQGSEAQQRQREYQEQMRKRQEARSSAPYRRTKQEPSKSDELDDSSPTAGNEAWTSAASGAEMWEELSNSSSQSAPQRQQSRQPPQPWDRQPSTRPSAPPPSSSSSSSSPFGDDDASPTGGLFQDEVFNPQSQSQSQHQSSWDRLRRGGAPVPLQRPQQPKARRGEPERKDGSTMDDSYTFADGNEEQKKDRERAQREFDARVERERQGRDFSSDENKKW